MSAYFEYLGEMLKRFFIDLGYFFYKAIISPWADVGNNFSNYNSILAKHSGDFGFLGWFFFALFAFIAVHFSS